jgi:LuxR family maltose regulon positive regulatory protein
MYQDRITANSSITDATGIGSPHQHDSATVADGQESAPPLPEALSPREMEVLSQLPSELTAAEIGAVLYISANTVRAHLRSIYRKLGASRRREATVQARKQGLL